MQIVTAFEYAWQKATHALAYKTGELNWSTKRIAAQLRAAVEQLDLLVVGASTAASLVTPSPWPDLEEQREILEGFRVLIDDKVIPEELTPDRWSRFAENVQSLLGPRRNRELAASKVIDLCADKARELTNSTFPRLVSLHQFVMGVILENSTHRIPGDYRPLATAEFRQVFPGVTEIAGGNTRWVAPCYNAGMDESPELSLVNVGRLTVAILAFVLICGGLCAGVIFLLTSGQNAAVDLIRRLRNKS